jgi:hypothetical protein
LNNLEGHEFIFLTTRHKKMEEVVDFINKISRQTTFSKNEPFSIVNDITFRLYDFV